MSKQAPDAKLPNDFAQGGPAKVAVRKPGTTSPKAGRDPVQPNNRGNQQQN
jgi:hypothetical protein